MKPSKKTRDPIPEQFETIEAAGEFWDAHDLADYADLTEEVEIAKNLERQLPDDAGRQRQRDSREGDTR